MLEDVRKYGLLLLTLFLLGATILIFYLDFQARNRMLTVAVLDIGQGDAIFIESPTGTQVLVDAGPPRKILGALQRVMPAFDRTLDAIIMTHPDQDHIGGFREVLDLYKVKTAFEAGSFSDSRTYANLKTQLADQGIENILARRGMRLHLGGGAVLDILFPDRDVSDWTTNDASIIAKLSFGENSIMLTGDATVDTEKIVLSENSAEYLDVDILKVGHHGSKTSTSESFVEALTPEYTAISVGSENNYGHPTEQVLATLTAAGAQILRTDELGTIVFKCARIEPCKINSKIKK